MDQLLVLFLSGGYALARFGLAKSSDYKIFANLVFYICLPASILASFQGIVVPASLHILIIVLALSFIVSAALSWTLAALLKLDKKTYYALLICGFFGNIIYLGFPFVEMILGNASLPLAGVYASFYNIAVFAVLIPAIAARLGTSSNSGAVKVLTNPAVLSTLLGIIILLLRLDISAISPYITAFASLTTPLALISMGIFIAGRFAPVFDKNLISIILSKCVFFPLITLILLMLSGQWSDGKEIFLLSLMPVAVSNFVIVESLDLGKDKLVMDAIITTTILSLLLVFGLSTLTIF